MTRFTFTYLRPIVLLLTVLVLFQCCKVYDKQKVTIEQAINKDNKEAKYIKIIFKNKYNKSEFRYESIYYKNNLLYGKIIRYETTWINDEKFPIGPEEIYEVQINEDEIVKIYLLTPSNH